MSTESLTFRTTVRLGGKTATGLVVPPEVVEALGAGRQPRVRVTLGRHEYRSSVAARGGEYLIALSAENRAAAGVAAGDDVEVTLALDTEPRELEIPADLVAALASDPPAQAFFDSISYSRRRRFVLGVEGAKTQATRQRRIAKAVEDCRAGKG